MTFHSEQHARKKGKVGSANVRLARVCTNWNPTPMRFSHIDAIPQKRALQLHRCDNDMCAVKSQPLPLRPILMTFLAFSPPAVWPGLDLDTLPHMALHCISCPISLTFQCVAGCYWVLPGATVRQQDQRIIDHASVFL